MSKTRPSRTVLLHFAATDAEGKADADGLTGQLSAVVQVHGDLWLASDESNSVERLTRTRDGEYGRHRAFRLADYLELPDGDASEIDIEGLAADDGYLWIAGSHGLKRRKARPGKAAAGQIHRLAELRADGNRYLLARVPLRAGEDGHMILDTRVPDAGTTARENAGTTAGENAGTTAKGNAGKNAGENAGKNAGKNAGARERTAARLMGGKNGNLLMDALRLDEHLAPFLAIPSKDNGLDIEGIAVHGARVFLGLRGPVLRGWAVVLELCLADAAPGYLRMEPVGKKGALYRKHFLDLRGLGVRDLRLRGRDLLILAGPTMDLDGPAAVYRWRKALDVDRAVLLGKGDVEEVVSVPYGTGEHNADDHPEGLALLGADGDEPESLLVVYDSPAARRKRGPSGVQADVFALR